MPYMATKVASATTLELCIHDSDISLTLGKLDDTSDSGRKGCVFEEQAGVD